MVLHKSPAVFGKFKDAEISPVGRVCGVLVT